MAEVYEIPRPDNKPNQSFTSRKMDWMNCAAYDRRLKPVDFEIAFIVMQHVNEQTSECYPSEQTIADKCGLSARHVRRSLKRLCQTGWLKSRRSRDANRYTVLFNNVNRILDDMLVDRERRKERSQNRRDRTRESYLERSDRIKESDPDRTRESYKHLRGTHLPRRESTEATVLSVIEGGQ